MPGSYDAILIVSFGGPEGMDDVLPFLQNVTRGRNVPPERLKEVAHHYEMFGGVSPINQQNRTIIEALKKELQTHGPDLPIYWGNRNWRPYLKDAFLEMKKDGITHALAFVTSAYSSYSSCRQYLEDIERARNEIDGAAQVDKIRSFYNHPLFIEANAENLREAISRMPSERQANSRIVFTAHSIPMSMAGGCKYSAQLHEAGTLIAKQAGVSSWELAYQSRSGPPSVPWLEPDILDSIKLLHSIGVQDLIIHPIGFVSDHMEVIYDLDHEAQLLCNELAINMQRASTASTNKKFIEMMRQLILERTANNPVSCMGNMGALPEICPTDCCPSGSARPPVSSANQDNKH